jgi:hypothetical protein
MAIRKQNRTIWVLAAIVLIGLIAFLLHEGKLDEFMHSPQSTSSGSEKSTAVEDLFGEKVTEQQPTGPDQFDETLDRLAACFQFPELETTDLPPVQIESLIQRVQETLGPVSHQADRWMSWHLKTRDGKERRLRLEITETDDGKMRRELHYFTVDHDGVPTPMDLPDDKTLNPTDEVIGQLLKEGEVFYKEKANVAFFSNNDRVEYLERNGELAEIEVFHKEHQFRCSNIKVPESCQCL